MTSVRREIKKIRLAAKGDPDSKFFESHDVCAVRSIAEMAAKKARRFLAFRKAVSPSMRSLLRQEALSNEGVD